MRDVVMGDNITLDSLVALHQKRTDVKILFDCSVRDFNLSQAQVFFDNGSNMDVPLKIGKSEGDRIPAIIKKDGNRYAGANTRLWNLYLG